MMHMPDNNGGREPTTRHEASKMLTGWCAVYRNEAERAGRHADARMWEATREFLAQWGASP